MSEQRQVNLGPPDGVERRQGDRRRSNDVYANVIEKSIAALEAEKAKNAELTQENEALQSEKERAEQETYLDGLTQIANRKALDETLKELVEIAENNNEPLALGIGDLKGLKLTNDTVSPTAGDALIKAAARGFQKAARDTDLVGRAGGDEFYVILPGFKPIPPAKPEDLLEDIRKRFVDDVNSEIKIIDLPDYIDTGLSFDVVIHQKGESAEDFSARAFVAESEAKEREYEQHIKNGGSDRRADDPRLQRRSSERPEQTAV